MHTHLLTFREYAINMFWSQSRVRFSGSDYNLGLQCKAIHGRIILIGNPEGRLTAYAVRASVSWSAFQTFRVPRSWKLSSTSPSGAGLARFEVGEL